MHLCDIKLYQTAPNKKTQIQAHENDDNTLRIAFEIIKLPLLLIVSSQVMKLKKKYPYKQAFGNNMWTVGRLIKLHIICN